MSNRYFTMSGNDYNSLLSVMPTSEKAIRSKNEIKDEIELPKRIYGNNYFRQQVLMMQNAKNYHMEIDRLHGLLHERRIPANRERFYRGRLAQLSHELKELEPYIKEIGK